MEENLNSKNVYKAAQILELSESASMSEIKDNYRKLIKKWHPDNCSEKTEKCKEKTNKIAWAYKIIIKYCNNYRYSFKKNEIVKNLPAEKRVEEKLEQQFQNDPLWN